MPSMLNSLAQGLKNYKSIAEYQLHNNTVGQSYDMAKARGLNRATAVAGAIGAGAATFLAPPAVIGAQAVKDYRQKQNAEMQRDKLTAMINCLRARGISQSGAVEMGNQIIMNHSAGYYISDADFKMWMVVASTLDPTLARFTSRMIARLESAKPELNLA
ncbi:MAG: hypothetical protein P4L85_25845 [Paludisphaera borealis]|uniref:hypothetical protein n=1 Tax=Paludisphaera borealis TaxID=1387353 RepID=UPI00284F9808|nr:hypothetical protein [Paludisphaera borealis]MDR3622803.1 hypothetical protein [Paludisphaera borealis]